jgi:hypothetical protein
VHRLSPTLRALFLVPLLAAGVEAAGRGWIGLWGSPPRSRSDQPLPSSARSAANDSLESRTETMSSCVPAKRTTAPVESV